MRTRPQQFYELRDTEIDELAAHLVEELCGWLFDHDVAGAVNAPRWALADRIRGTVRAAHLEAQRRVLEQVVR